MFKRGYYNLLAPIRRSSRILKPVNIFLGASGALCFLFTAKTIYLDSQPSNIPIGGARDSHRDLLSSLKRRKSTDNFDHRRPIDIDTKLREHEESYTTNISTGISRFDVVQVSSNDPNEDDHSTAIVSHPNGSWSFFALFDGHSGWETSAWLRENMIPAVVGALADLYNNYHVPDDQTFDSISQENNRDSREPPGKTVDDTIKDSFLRLDDDIVHWAVDRVFSTTSKQVATNLLAPAYAGSCALLAFYDSQTRLLRIAVTGDSRAVLGRRAIDENGKLKYEVHVLSTDQDRNNPLEIERLNNSPEHPGEEVIKNGRVLGMGPSRAFGDARWKWSEATQKRLKKEYLGRSKPGDVKTPPYLTAEPVITTTTVEKEDFLVMATDGLWECLQNEEAVGLIGVWMDRHLKQTHDNDGGVLERTALPVTLPEPDSTVRYPQWATNKAFVNVDGNAATHLARNALGGADKDLAEALLSMASPRSRTYRDDITAIVMFFD